MLITSLLFDYILHFCFSSFLFTVFLGHTERCIELGVSLSRVYLLPNPMILIPQIILGRYKVKVQYIKACSKRLSLSFPELYRTSSS